MYKERYPLRYYYNITKQAAKQRKKKWDLTFEDYVEFCAKTGYHEGRGQKPDSLTIDRINPSEGYTRENIRCLSHAKNSKRRNAPAEPDDYEDRWYGDKEEVYVAPDSEDESQPF